MRINTDIVKSHRFGNVCRFRFRIPCVFGLFTLLSLVSKAEAADFFLHDGDRVVFLGDSITEQRMYSNFIEAYALTRHPQWQLTFRNAGWAGDTAFFRSRCHPDGSHVVGVEEQAQAPMIDKMIRRSLGRDVLALKPTVVTIDFGMNDVGVSPTADAYNAYVRCLTRMVTVLQENGARSVLLTPQPVENKRPDPELDEKNLALRQFSDGLKEVAAKTGVPYVDQFDPYLKILRRERVGNPDKFIGGGRDSVHPGAIGHTLMAWTILKGLGATPLVSRAQLDYQSKTAVAAESCKIEQLKITDGGLAFDRLDEALPMPIHPNAEPALKLAPLMEDLNQYGLQITGLPPGDYPLSIDGVLVVTMTAAEWAKGCNLASSAGPITQQGLELLKEIGGKNDLYFKRWRNVQFAQKNEWVPAPDVETRRAAELARLDQQIAASEAKINQLRKPRPHRFELTTHLP